MNWNDFEKYVKDEDIILLIRVNTDKESLQFGINLCPCAADAERLLDVMQNEIADKKATPLSVEVEELASFKKWRAENGY